VIARSLPRSGIPRRFTDYEDYVSCVRAIGAAGQLGDYTRLWWDVRPQPRLGTIEVRALDAQHDLRTVAGLAALVHGLALHELDTRSGDDPPPEALEECCFRALRDGDRAFLQFEGRMQPLSRIATQACERARDRLPDPAALEEIQRVLCDGNGARGQRRAFVRAGMPGLVRWLVRATTARAAALRAMPPGPDSTLSAAVSA
jgi:carboxylate-amine ligase